MSNQDILRNRMLEASFLEPGDPRREEVEQAIAREGGWAGEEWVKLLEENRRLSREVARVELPAGLEERLLAIGARAGRAAAIEKMLGSRAFLRVAAVAVLTVAIGWAANLYLRRAGPVHEIETIAVLALSNHVTNPDVTVITLDPQYLEEHLRAAVPFEIVMPAVNNLSLIGGRSESLGTHPVVYTRWASGDGRCSLYQFRSSDFNLPEQTGKEVIPGSRVNCPVALDKNCDVVIWTESGRGYALVADSRNALNCVSNRGARP
ncbi:MAG: hypothetical protein V1794_05260 [Candidatus Glassbacteria bacterium]